MCWLMRNSNPFFINTLHTVAGERQPGITVYLLQKMCLIAFGFYGTADVKARIPDKDPTDGPGRALRSGVRASRIAPRHHQ